MHWWLPRERGGGRGVDWESEMQTGTYRLDKQEYPTR